MTPAWVCFYYGDDEGRDWRPLAEFVLEQLGPWLLDKVGDSAEVSVRRNGVGMPQGELSVRPGTVAEVTRSILGFAAFTDDGMSVIQIATDFKSESY